MMLVRKDTQDLSVSVFLGYPLEGHQKYVTYSQKRYKSCTIHICSLQRTALYFLPIVYYSTHLYDCPFNAVDFIMQE